ncbi:hypothetical protein [Sphingomonas sp.]|jgi:hypothetical protein|uniref:hypothetical protein n=1 Tax=Sphingomonas sp. TaxID=28214 RepID=UPI002ED9DF0B
MSALLIDMDREIIAMWDDGASAAEIAAATGVGEPHVETVVAEVGRRFDHVPFSLWISSEHWETEA